MNARRVMRRVHAADERGAEARAWSVVSAGYSEARSAGALPAPPRSRRFAVVVPAVAVLVIGLVLSPAGASVRRWISQALGEPHAAPALFSLPAPGTLLVSGPHGSWTVGDDGSSRRLGSWTHAAWSPRALYVAVAGADELAAVDRRGVVQWALARPAVRDPSWYAPTGFRVAYLSAGDLRVVAGNGIGDHLVARGVAPVAPAWESGHPYRLAYATRSGRIIVRDADSGLVIWSAAGAGGTRALAWSADGTELLVAGRDGVRVYGSAGRLVSAYTAGSGAPIGDAALSPDGRELAILGGNDVDLLPIGGADRARPVLSGEGLQALAWAPNGRWLVVSWPAADQLVFVRVRGGPKILAVSHIRRQLGGAFPRLDGWCCS